MVMEINLDWLVNSHSLGLKEQPHKWMGWSYPHSLTYLFNLVSLSHDSYSIPQLSETFCWLLPIPEVTCRTIFGVTGVIATISIPVLLTLTHFEQLPRHYSTSCELSHLFPLNKETRIQWPEIIIWNTHHTCKGPGKKQKLTLKAM